MVVHCLLPSESALVFRFQQIHDIKADLAAVYCTSPVCLLSSDDRGKVRTKLSKVKLLILIAS
jgi:hypothetical protein